MVQMRLKTIELRLSSIPDLRQPDDSSQRRLFEVARVAHVWIRTSGERLHGARLHCSDHRDATSSIVSQSRSTM